LRLIDHKYPVLIRKSDQNVFTQAGLVVALKNKQELTSTMPTFLTVILNIIIIRNRQFAFE
jgi:hypothetical protein